MRFDTDSTTCKELILPKDMVKYLVNKFTSYVPDKDIQEKVLVMFTWEGKLYQFTCLPFGLAPAPLLFTKLLKPVMPLLRRLGLRMIIYLNDIIVLNQTQEGILRDRDSVLFGFCDQLGEVSATTIADHGVSGVCNKFPRNETHFAGSKIESSCRILPRSDSTTVFCQDNSQGDRETDIIYAGSFPSTLALSTPAKVANQRSVEGKILRSNGLSQSELSQ